MNQEMKQSFEKEIEMNAATILHKLNIPINIRGYHYLREAIFISVGNTDVIGCITKLLYPEIAKKHGASSPSVERAIRNAIGIAWDRGAGPVFAGRYGYCENTKPSNSEFIGCIAEEIYFKLK